MPARLSQAWSRALAAIALASISLVAAAAVGSIFLSTALRAGAELAAPGPGGPADGILVITGLSGTVLALWLGLGMTLSALSTLPGALGLLCRQLAARVAPVAVRKVVAFILGTTLTAALIPGTAVAGITHGTPAATVVTSQQVQHPSGGGPVAAPEASFRFVSDPPHVTESMDAAPPPEWSTDRRATPQQVVVVLRGDTLWSIAARHLGQGATAAQITAEWHRWLSTNRDVIGADPDLILPGQELLPPASARAGS